MQALTGNSPLGSLYATTSEEKDTLLIRVQNLIKNATDSERITDKRAKFEEAFQELKIVAKEKILSSKENAELHKLFLNYSTQTLYNQEVSGSRELGFFSTAILMEYSYLLQLQDLNQNNVTVFDWTEAKSLDDLINKLVENNIHGAFLENNSDISQIIKASEGNGTREELSKTLVFITYSQQNIPSVRNNVELGKKCEELTEMLIGNETIEQRRRLADYHYNRNGVIAERMQHEGQIPAGIQDLRETRAKLYEEVKNELKSVCETTDSFLQGKLAQISNMQGLLILQTSKDEKRELREEEAILALPYLQEAFTQRELIVKATEEFTTDGQLTRDRKEQEYFLSNIRTGIIACLLAIKSDNSAELEKHVHELEAFEAYMEKIGDQNTYRESYRNAIAKYKAAQE